MNLKLKKIFSLITAAGVLAVSASILPAPVSAIEDGEVIFNAECETLDGASLWTSIYETQLPGYSGEGFAYLTSNNITMEVEAPEEGMYSIDVRYTQILDQGARMQTISVNGRDTSFNLDNTSVWTDYNIGIFRLNEGTNTIILKPQYGYASYDTITISKAISKDYSKATDTLTDPLATDETKALMKYLKSVYGNHIISGQQEIYGSGHDGNMELEFEYIADITGGLQPAIRGFDMMNYNPLYGWEDGTTERLIDWVNNKGGIATVAWHINVPIDFANYEVGDAVDWTKCSYKNYQSSNSTFNTANAVIEGTKEYEYFQAAMEDLAEQLLLCQEAGVPIIFRPLHEAQGNEGNYSDGTAWFWWGDRGAEVYKELWKLLYTTMTETYGLHNLIWEYNSYNYSNSHTWYPGDEYVDIVAYDKYNVDYNRGDGLTSGPNVSAISSIFNYIYNLVDGGKMIAMSENDTVPTVENMIIEDAGWLYFCPWYGDHLMSERYQDPETLSGIYNSDYCITLDELPADLYVLKDDPDPTDPPVTTTEPQTTTTTEPGTALVSGNANGDSEVDVADAVFILQGITDPSSESFMLTDEAKKAADCYDPGSGVDAEDAFAVIKFKANIIKELPFYSEQ